MLGPLIAGIVVRLDRAARCGFPLPPFVVAQGIVGCLIAKMVPLSIVGDVLSHWVLFTVGVLSVVAVSSLLGWLMTRLQMLPGTTALWGTSPGAASVMTIMAEYYGADVRPRRLHAVSAGRAGGGDRRARGAAVRRQPRPCAAAIVWFPPVAWLPLAETLALAILGPLLARWLRIPAGAFLVPLVAGIVLTHFGLMTIELPTWLLAASYALRRLERRPALHAAAADPCRAGAAAHARLPPSP